MKELLKFGTIIRKEGSKKSIRHEVKRVCSECGGSGAIEVIDHFSHSNHRQYSQCPMCEGSGIVIVESIVNFFPYKVINHQK